METRHRYAELNGEILDYYVRKGRRERAEAFGAAFRNVRQQVRRIFANHADPGPTDCSVADTAMH